MPNPIFKLKTIQPINSWGTIDSWRGLLQFCFNASKPEAVLPKLTSNLLATATYVAEYCDSRQDRHARLMPKVDLCCLRAQACRRRQAPSTLAAPTGGSGGGMPRMRGSLVRWSCAAVPRVLKKPYEEDARAFITIKKAFLRVPRCRRQESAEKKHHSA